MAHFGNIILTSIVTHGNSDKIPRDKSCHYWRAYLYMPTPVSIMNNVENTGIGYKKGPRFGEVCSCCCLLILPGFARNIHTFSPVPEFAGHGVLLVIRQSDSFAIET